MFASATVVMEGDTVEGTQLHYGDFIVIVAYFAFVLFIGLWVCITIKVSYIYIRSKMKNDA